MPMEMSVHFQPCMPTDKSAHLQNEGKNKQKTLSRSRGLGVQPLEREADNCVVIGLVNVGTQDPDLRPATLKPWLYVILD